MESFDDNNLFKYIENQNVRINELVDEKGFNLLHHAVLKG